jgi:hypothetical protein
MLNPYRLFSPLVQTFTNQPITGGLTLQDVSETPRGAAPLRFQERSDVFIGDTVCTLSVLFLVESLN